MRASILTMRCGILLAVGMLLSLSSIARAQTLAPVADAYVWNDAQTTNYGAAAVLRSAFHEGKKSTLVTFLKFDLSAVQTPIAIATLRLYGNVEHPRVTENVTVYAVANTTWPEGTINWRNQPALGSPLQTTRIGITAQWYSWNNLAAYLEQERLAGRGIVTLALRPPATNTQWIAFNSRESASAQPQLVITTLPRAPSLLAATAVSSSQMSLSWSDNSNNETGFRVERKTGATGSWSEVATVAADVTTYNDSGLAASTTYYYRVRAYNAGGDSPYSNEVSATTHPPGLVSRFNVIEPGANAIAGKIYTKVAGQNLGLEIVALTASNVIATGFTGGVAVEIVDNASGGPCSGLPTVATLTPQAFTPGDLGRHALTAPNTVSNVYRNVKVRVKYPASSPTVVSCSGDNFAIRPSALTFAAQDANRTTAGTTRNLNLSSVSGSTVHNAGRPFRIAVTARNAAGSVTTNYDGTPTAVLTPCAGDACTATVGALTLGTWAASGGTVVTSTASYNDVGAFNLTLEDASFASVDSSDGSTAAQRTVSSSPAAVGRFVPDRYLVSATSIVPRSDVPSCSGSSFTYMGERMDVVFTLTAVAYPSGTTVRYSGSLARLPLASPGSFAFGAVDGSGAVSLSSRLNTSLGATGTWANGAAPIAAVLSVNRNAAPDGPYESVRVGIAPSDADGVTLDPAALTLDTDNDGVNERAAIGAATALRFGRLRLQNAIGSELIALPVPIEAQYWNGSAFVTNTADNCTSLAAANIALTNYQRNLGSGETAVAVGGAFTAGVGSLRLTAPGPGNLGSVDVSVNLGETSTAALCSGAGAASTGSSKAYLRGAWCSGTFDRDPTARATFGLYRSANQLIYRRENF